MPTKCCWMIHGSLTSERKASTSPSSFINHSTLLLNRALKRQAPCLYITCTSKFERSTGSERVDALGLRAVEVIICMITRDFSVISMTSQASLSLSLSLSQKSLTHNIGSASALPIIPCPGRTFAGGSVFQSSEGTTQGESPGYGHVWPGCAALNQEARQGGRAGVVCRRCHWIEAESWNS